MRRRSILSILSFFLLLFFVYQYKSYFKNEPIEIVNKEFQKEEISIISKALFFVNGISNAIYDNVANIWHSFWYPIESMVRIYNFCKKILKSFFLFVCDPQPDYVYAKRFETFIDKVAMYFERMPVDQKYNWFGYVAMDFVIGFVAPAGLGWKALSLTKNAVISVKGIKYIDLLNRVTTIDSNVIKIVDSTNRASLLNVKYGFEYADQFRAYLQDIVRRESY